MIYLRNMLNKIIFLLFFFPISFYAQSSVELSATYYDGGLNSPWSIGIDYDLGFGKLFSMNVQLIGGVSSQVNRSSTFGDVFFGEIQIAPRLYINKFDTWEGVFLSIPLRLGLYNIPIRTQDNPTSASSKLIINRSTMFQYGIGIYLGYRWKRNLVSDMSDLPFMMVLEPYLGWTWDAFVPISNTDGFSQNGVNINWFTVGISFKIGFYTYKKSKATLEREQAALEEQEQTILEAPQKTNATTQNTDS